MSKPAPTSNVILPAFELWCVSFWDLLYHYFIPGLAAAIRLLNSLVKFNSWEICACINSWPLQAAANRNIKYNNEPLMYHFCLNSAVLQMSKWFFTLMEQNTKSPVLQKRCYSSNCPTPLSSSAQFSILPPACFLPPPSLPPSPLPSSIAAWVYWEVSTVEAWVWEGLPWFTAIACASAAMHFGYHLSECHTVRCSLASSLSLILPSSDLLPFLKPLSCSLFFSSSA